MVLCVPILTIFFIGYLTQGFHSHFIQIWYMTRGSFGWNVFLLTVVDSTCVFLSFVDDTHIFCRNPSLGLMTKARACKGASQERGPGVWESVGINIHTPKWTSIVGSWSLGGLPKLQTMIAKGQNPSPYRVFYIIGKLVKLKCPKWAHMTHLDIYNTSYGQKKGQESIMSILNYFYT
jgi:hypothetical protein